MGIRDHPTARRAFLYYWDGEEWEPATASIFNEIKATPIVSPTTGAGAIAATYAPGVKFWLHSITLHLSGVPTTAEDFTITLDANDGADYDTLLYSIDPSVFSVQDIEYVPEYGPRLFEAGDAIDVAYTNTDGNTYGLRIVATLA